MWLFPVLEDLAFFIALGFHQRRFPFPVSNWYDDYITKLVHLGQATTFWPFAPRFYYILPSIYLLGCLSVFGSRIKAEYKV